MKKEVKCSYCDTYSSHKDSMKLAVHILDNYHGVSGFLCDACYAEIEHDDAGNPLRPAQYVMFMLKHDTGPKSIQNFRVVEENGSAELYLDYIIISTQTSLRDDYNMTIHASQVLEEADDSL